MNYSGEILDLIRQNPLEDVTEIINNKFGKQGVPVTKDSENSDDEIEVI